MSPEPSPDARTVLRHFLGRQGGGLQLVTAELKGAEPALKVDVLKVLRALVKRGMVPFVERSDVIGGAIVCAGASSPGSPRLEPPRH